MSRFHIPDTAPFAADEIAALNQIIPDTSAEQRIWLSGFLAGCQAGSAPVPEAAAAPSRKAPLTILYATESGNAEALAAKARKNAAKRGFAARVVDMADTTPAEVAGMENLLVIASTWGEGEPPQRAADFYNALMADNAPSFAGVRFGVLALGDRAYVNFCQTGRELDERLAMLGGQRVGNRADCDLDFETTAHDWLETTLKEIGPEDASGTLIRVDFSRNETSRPVRQANFEAEITELINLNSSRSSTRTFHMELSLEGAGMHYEPGDALALAPRNDPLLVEQILSIAGASEDAALHDALLHRYDICTLTRPQIAAYAKLTQSSVLLALSEDENEVSKFLPGRHVIDLLEMAPHRLGREELKGLLRPLPSRLYSIASSRKAAPDEAHLLIAEVTYETHGKERRGVASGDVARRRKVGQRVTVQLKPNPHFRVPTDTSRDVIMIGPGTGIAPFRGFMQERQEMGGKGRNWLFFGNRNFTHDFLYQLEWQDFMQNGTLTRLDTAFSRDQRSKIYVQNRLWDTRRDVFAWLQEGAALYVCGDAKAMAKDVHTVLLNIATDQGGMTKDAATAWVDGLRREGRYLRDVY